MASLEASSLRSKEEHSPGGSVSASVSVESALPASISAGNIYAGKITAVFGDITISSNFDSGNLAKAEECKHHEGSGTREFDLWTSRDCAETEFENGNRSWFYFSVCTPQNFSDKILRFNIRNMNRQCKLYQQGLTPITKTIPGRGTWERLRSRVDYENVEEGMKITFQISITDNRRLTTYFAFCYPHSYSESQRRLTKLDNRYKTLAPSESTGGVYYYRELLSHSLEGRRIDLITITSWERITNEREARLPQLFPNEEAERCHIFKNKRVVFVSSRVHPGETPSSHVFNGLLHFLLQPHDARAIAARRHFVFKLIPMLNPDGVFRGHYRTDTQGANLNRYYLNPDPMLHPSIFAAKSLFQYYHGRQYSSSIGLHEKRLGNLHAKSEILPNKPKISLSSLSEPPFPAVSMQTASKSFHNVSTSAHSSRLFKLVETEEEQEYGLLKCSHESSMALYVDLHAHATKRGVFMYGNHFNHVEVAAENMLFPKLMSLNSPHIDFEHCVFTERNMYVADKRDGMSKEGSGRVAMHKATGIIPCYTLECNYNSGRQCNAISEATMDDGKASPAATFSPLSHRFTIADFEQVGRAIVCSLLDQHHLNPWTRLPTTVFGSSAGVRQSLIQKLSTTRSRKNLTCGKFLLLTFLVCHL